MLSTCSSSFMRSTGAVAVRLTAPATPADRTGAAGETQSWLFSWCCELPKHAMHDVQRQGLLSMQVLACSLCVGTC